MNVGVAHQSVLGDSASKQPQLTSVVSEVRLPSFKKYIPVPPECLQQSSRVPMIVHDQVDRSEWIRAQLAVDVERRRRQAQRGSTLHRALSDSSLVSDWSSVDWSQSDDDDDDDDIDWTAVSPELEALCRSRRSSWRRTPLGMHVYTTIQYILHLLYIRAIELNWSKQKCHFTCVARTVTRKVLITQRGTRNSDAPSYASDP